MKYEQKCYLRLAGMEDMNLLFEWANNKEVRTQAFSSEPITYEEHIQWFEKLMNDPSQVQYIYMMENRAIGQIRFSMIENRAIIDYSIAQDMRGLGHGKELLRLGREEICKSYPNVTMLVGQVKKGNIASEKCFSECGYRESFKQFELKCKE